MNQLRDQKEIKKYFVLNRSENRNIKVCGMPLKQ